MTNKKVLKPLAVLRSKLDMAESLVRSEITSVAFVSEEKLISGDSLGGIKIWDLKTRRVLSEFSIGSRVLKVDKLLGRLYVHSKDQIIRIYEDFGRNLVTELVADCFSFCSFEIIVDENSSVKIAVPKEHICRILKELKVVTELRLPSDCGLLMKLKFIDFGTLSLLFECGKIVLWDLGENVVTRIIQTSSSELCWTNFDYFSGKFYLCSAQNIVSRLQFSMTNNLSLNNEMVKDSHTTIDKSDKDGCSVIKIDSSGKYAVVGLWNGSCVLLQLKDWKQLGTICFHAAQINCIQFCKGYFAVGSNDGIISLWKPY